jgi:hypothetical protein
MNLKKHILLFLFAIIAAISLAQDLRLILFNKTGQRLDSLAFDDLMLGNLENNDSLYITQLNGLTMNGPYLIHKVTAKLLNNKMVQSLSGCGTKSSQVNSGVYKYEIVLYKNTYSERIGLIKM